MQIIKKEYFEINIAKLQITYGDGKGQILDGDIYPVDFKKEHLEDLMAAFNWLYHEVHGLPHKK